MLLALVGVLAGMLWGSPAEAGEDARLRYELEDPDGKCANEAAFRARVVSRLGYDPFREEATLELRVRIVARGALVRAEISAAQPGKPAGKRTLEDPRCDALGETVASAVALALDPVGAGAEHLPAEPAPLPPPVTTPVIPPPPVAPPPVAVVPSESPRLALVAYADFTTTFARTPGILLGGRLGGGLRRGALAIAVEGHAEATAEPTLIANGDRVLATVFSAAVVPCGYLGLVQLCGVATLGSRQIQALDVVGRSAHGALFAVLGARGGIEVPLAGPLAFRASVELGVPLIRDRYLTDGIARATTSPLEGGASAGLLGRFP